MTVTVTMLITDDSAVTDLSISNRAAELERRVRKCFLYSCRNCLQIAKASEVKVVINNLMSEKFDQIALILWKTNAEHEGFSHSKFQSFYKTDGI